MVKSNLIESEMKIGKKKGEKKLLRVGTLFSGIGAFEQALKQMKIKHKIVFACDNGERYLKATEEEIRKYAKSLGKTTPQELEEVVDRLYEQTGKPNFVKQSYFANYDITEDRWHNDVRFMDGAQYKGKVDILVGGSPCQSFSVMGKHAGLEDTRGTLFYDYARIIRESQPSVFIYENVPGMLIHDKGRTWDVIKSVFESLNYKIHYQVLDAKDYGIPQNRKRLFVVGLKNKDSNFVFPEKKKLTTTLFDYLETDISEEFYLGEKGFAFVTDPSHPNRTHVNCNIAKTQKANQQFNWNGDFIFEELDKKHTPGILKRAYVGEWNAKKGVARKLTNRECLRLMGFSDSFKIVVPSMQSYRQSGNSIVVNVLKSIIANLREEI